MILKKWEGLKRICNSFNIFQIHFCQKPNQKVVIKILTTECIVYLVSVRIKGLKGYIKGRDFEE